MDLTCHVCKKPNVEYIHLCSRMENGDLIAPHRELPSVVVLSHKHCPGDYGYFIELKKLFDDPVGWEQHLGEKRWYTWEYRNAIRTVFRALSKKAPQEQPQIRRKKLTRVQTYFIQSEAGGPIKIGKSINPKSRLHSLQTAHAGKLRLIKVLTGDHETRLHTRFKHLRLSGEWFKSTQELTDFLSNEQ